MISDIKQWLGVCQKPYIETLPQEKLLDACKQIRVWLNSEIDELEKAIIDKDYDEQLNAIVDAYWILGNYAFHLNLPVKDLLLEHCYVKLSNYTKYCKTESEAIKTVEAYRNGTHPNKKNVSIETTYKSVVQDDETFFVIYGTSGEHKDKILKSINFKDVDVIKLEIHEKVIQDCTTAKEVSEYYENLLNSIK